MNSDEARPTVRRIAILGNHPPRRCGIATFTHDLSGAMRGAGLEVDVVAMDDGSVEEYPAEVVCRVPDGDRPAYRAAAEWLNAQGYDAVCLQHEYGIFGGPAGAYLLDLVRELHMPVVTTLHTVLAKPNPDQQRVMDELLQLSERAIVMTRKGLELLRQAHGVAAEKVALVPHGIPDLPKVERAAERERRGVGDRTLLLTFGLLSPDKGIEVAIEAMAEVVKDHPEALYLFAGQTHPHIVRNQGEKYRDGLKARIEELGLDDNVRLDDGYMDDEALGRLLAAADLYVTPYLKKEQITSGTLSFAVGNGIPTVSTPFWHAEELLAGGRGILVQPRDPGALADGILRMLDDDDERTAISQRARAVGEGMRWPVIGGRYRTLMEEAREDAAARLRPIRSADVGALPAPVYTHLVTMSDDTGLLQHASYDVPTRAEGYCTDDNARGLVLTVLAAVEGGPQAMAITEALQSRYLAFLDHALDRETGRFVNFMSFDRRWLERMGSNDSHGRAIWGLGALAGGAHRHGRRDRAKELLRTAIPAMNAIQSPRAIAYALLGLVPFADADPGSEAPRVRDRFAARLFSAFVANAAEGWPFPEPALTYGNARLPQALIAAGVSAGREAWVAQGLETLEWLMKAQTGPDGVFASVGNQGWWPRGAAMAAYDQQPIEAAGAVSACLAAHAATGERTWLREAGRAFAWFLGANTVGKPVYDPTNGGGFDGLTPDGPSRNLGAESTLSYLTALLEMRLAESRPDVAAKGQVRYAG